MMQTVSAKSLVEAFLRQSDGRWRSQRRYYTLQQQQIQTVESLLSIRFLPAGDPALMQLALRHQLAASVSFACGATVSWQSHDLDSSSKTVSGTTCFGVLHDRLYRDRAFSTTQPVIAGFHMRDPDTMCLVTEYGGNRFEEEIRLLGSRYRTRQTIISRAGEQQMIGQYVETRL